MEELRNLIEQLIDLLEQSDEGFEQLWSVRSEILKLIYFAETESVPLADGREIFDSKCRDIFACLMKDKCNVQEYTEKLQTLLNIIDEFKGKYDYYAELNNGEMAWSVIHENDMMRQTTHRLDSEYERFMRRIKEHDNFALIRCADGEYSFMNGLPVDAADNWYSPTYVTPLGKALRESIEYSAENYYYGISCPCCDPKAYFWYLKNVGNIRNITFSNIWVNCNYHRFTRDFLELERDTVLIANYRAEGKRIGNLNVLKHYSVSDDCVSFWENDSEKLIKQIVEDFGDRKGLLYAVAAGPMSGPLIHKLYDNNPYNCYIDFGSSLDSWFRETKSRLYMIPGSMYAERNCFLPDPNVYGYPQISVVMTLYKRPEALLKQLEAIEDQSIKPLEIILFQDAIENDSYRIELLENIKKRFSSIKVSETNQGVWGRFLYAAEEAKGEYICVIDDDTIPGKRWLENCYMHMIQKEGIYGTIGIGMFDYTNYPMGDGNQYRRFGWDNPVQHCMEVDFAGHCWFMKRDYLIEMIKISSEYRARYKYVGEDAFVSFANSKVGIRTIIPTHYSFNSEFWGSISKEYGKEKCALSVNIDNLNKMKEAVKELVEDYGWDVLQFRHPHYLESYGKYEF